MIISAFKAILLTLVRDRASLALTFVLPPILFLVLSSVFAGSAGELPTVNVGILRDSDASSHSAIGSLAPMTGGFHVRRITDGGIVALRSLLRRGELDVGLIEHPSDPGRSRARITVMEAPGRGLAATMLIARIEAATQTSKTRGAGHPLATRQDEQTHKGRAANPATRIDDSPEIVRESSSGAPVGEDSTSYYACAVAAMFLLFSSIHLAAGLVEERLSGIHERLSAVGRVSALVYGRLAFGVAQGTIQTGLVFATASVVRDLDWPAAPSIFLLVCVLASAAATASALLLSAGCSTPRQAQMASTFVVLLFSAVGGSMVPSFLMPDWLRAASWYTPNAWIIEALQNASVRQTSMVDVMLPSVVLAILTVVALLLARVIYGRSPLI